MCCWVEVVFQVVCVLGVFWQGEQLVDVVIDVDKKRGVLCFFRDFNCLLWLVCNFDQDFVWVDLVVFGYVDCFDCIGDVGLDFGFYFYCFGD